MRALQVHYTSCRNGLSGRPGFQIRSASAGITPADLAEIEARNSYRPPLDAPASPSAEELALRFPIALRSYRLPGGALALTRTVYVGRDYSGRWGNFFAHTLVLGVAEDPPPPGWPIDYFDWSGWAGGLTPAEDTDDLPAPLPALELAPPGDDVSAAASFGFAELSRLLDEEPGREPLLAAMLDSLLRGLAERKPVVVKASPLDLPFWIGCLQKLLPRSLAWSFAISTYEDDPRQSASITGTSGQTYFELEQPELRRRVYGFDVNGSIPGAAGDAAGRSETGRSARHAAAMAAWLRQQPAAVERYFRWLDELGNVAVEDFAPSLDLHRLIGGEDRALENDTEPLLELASRTPGIDPRRIFEAFLNLGHLPSIAAESAVFRFLIGASPGMADGWPARVEDAWLGRAFPAWFEEQPEVRVFEAFWRFFRKSDGQRFAAAARRWLADLAWLRVPPHGEPADEVVHFLLVLAAAAERPRIWREPAAAPFFQRTARLPGGKEKMLALAGRDGRELLDLFDLLGRDGSAADRDLGRALGAAIESWPEAPGIRQVFEQAGAWEVLFGEWLGRLDACADAGQRRAAWADYAGAVLSHTPHFRKAALPWIRFTVLAEAPARELFPALHQWLSDGSLGSFPPDLFRQCVGRAVNELPLEGPDAQLDELADLLFQLGQERQLRFAPDRARLRLALRPGASIHLGKRQLEELFGALEGLGETELRDFLRRYLARSLPAADKDQHEKVLTALDRPALEPVAARAYADALRNLDDSARFRLARIWVQAKETGGLARRIGAAAEDFLIDWLAAHPAELEHAKARFPRLRDGGASWPRWLKRIEKRRRNPLFRARSWCSGMLKKRRGTDEPE